MQKVNYQQYQQLKEIFYDAYLDLKESIYEIDYVFSRKVCERKDELQRKEKQNISAKERLEYFEDRIEFDLAILKSMASDFYSIFKIAQDAFDSKKDDHKHFKENFFYFCVYENSFCKFNRPELPNYYKHKRYGFLRAHPFESIFSFTDEVKLIDEDIKSDKPINLSDTINIDSVFSIFLEALKENDFFDDTKFLLNKCYDNIISFNNETNDIALDKVLEVSSDMSKKDKKTYEIFTK